MPRRLFRALLAAGPATVGAVTACLVVVASLVTCARGCHVAAAFAAETRDPETVAFLERSAAALAARDASR